MAAVGHGHGVVSPAVPGASVAGASTDAGPDEIVTEPRAEIAIPGACRHPAAASSGPYGDPRGTLAKVAVAAGRIPNRPSGQ